MRALLPFALAGVLSSCFSMEVKWQRVEAGSSIVHENGYTLELPISWARFGSFLTRDGGQLQAITFLRLERDEARVLIPELDPFAPDFADRLAKAAEQEGTLREFECKEVTLAGRRAIQVHFEGPFPPSPGLVDMFTGVFFPVENARWRYEIDWVLGANGDEYLFLYGAPPLVYFERDLPVFERLVASLKVDEPARPTR